MTLPTPEEQCKELWRKNRRYSGYEAIRVDREAIAKAVEARRKNKSAPDPTEQEWRDGYLAACDQILAILRPENKKGEPPLDDSPTAPLR